MCDDHKEAIYNPPPRKVIEVSSGSDTNPIIALCDDNSIWYYTKATNKWTRVADLPMYDK
jgi:hypothetical protein